MNLAEPTNAGYELHSRSLARSASNESLWNFRYSYREMKALRGCSTFPTPTIKNGPRQLCSVTCKVFLHMPRSVGISGRRRFIKNDPLARHVNLYNYHRMGGVGVTV
jgi:hypothetical protein